MPVNYEPGEPGTQFMRLNNLLGAVCAAAMLCAASFASAVIPASDQIKAVEFYHAKLDHYFISTNPAEIADLDTGVHEGWKRTGYEFAVIKAGSTFAGSVAMCRFYSQSLDTHFYSATATECADMKANPELSKVWQFEADEVFRALPVDPATGACPADTTAAYRLWNKRTDSNHRYTDQLAAYYYMLTKGYLAEGNGSPTLPVIFCIPSGSDVVPTANASAPSCTITASSGTPALGATLNLSASCTNNPTFFYWNNCTSATAQCSTSRTTAGSVPYTLYAANSAGPADPVTINVNWGAGGGGGGAVPTCQLLGNNGSPQVGQTVTLSANCNNTPTGYTWQECNILTQDACSSISGCATTATSCQVTTSVSGDHLYRVAGTNGAGTGAYARLTLNWTGTSNPGNPTNPNVGAPVCTLFASNINPTIGSSINLTASCTNGPTSYSWGGASGCPSNYYLCPVSSNTVGTVTYSVSATNSGGTGGVTYVNVEWKDSVASTLPVCTLGASKTTPNVGEQITLTASCTNTNAASTYAWTGTPSGACSASSATCTLTDTAGGKVYDVVATNTTGSSTKASIGVSWFSPTPPTCTITPSNAAPTTGTTITITSNCSNLTAGTTYAWTGCSSSTASCTDTQPDAAAGPKTYTLVATNAYGASNTASTTVAWTAPPQVPPVCTISASTTAATVGVPVTLTASCTYPQNITNYQWTNCTPANGTSPTCTATASSAGPVTYTVVATNPYGFSNGAQTTVNWTVGTPVNDYCSQYAGVIESDIPWGDYSRYFTASLGGFPQGVVWLIKITVPSSPSSYGTAGYTTAAEWQASPASRTMTLSQSRCDFRTADSTGARGPVAASGGTTPTINWNVGAGGGGYGLEPGKTYYFAVKNENCGASSCNMSTTIAWPR